MKTLEFGVLCLMLFFVWKRMLKPVLREYLREIENPGKFGIVLRWLIF